MCEGEENVDCEYNLSRKVSHDCEGAGNPNKLEDSLLLRRFAEWLYFFQSSLKSSSPRSRDPAASLPELV